MQISNPERMGMKHTLGADDRNRGAHQTHARECSLNGSVEATPPAIERTTAGTDSRSGWPSPDAGGQPRGSEPLQHSPPRHPRRHRVEVKQRVLVTYHQGARLTSS
jgi:hypothetical protein